ncbi:MAG: hypothetical protein J0M19_01210 [Sphingomonadales bacterium]|nr:hypothetical protein [Sphingomonadales bacterium]
MNRLFLAILALFAGIATQVAPAAARVHGDTEIGAVVDQSSESRAIASAQTIAAPVAQGMVPQEICEAGPCLSRVGPPVRTVLLGPDRAHE